MATQLNTTELDFKKIKDNLKSYLKNSDSSFKDYDFEGSGLNHLLDVLAYNTHYNAITAHMAVNESFLDTAQVRANVVSHAKLIGYTPKSAASSQATISLKLKRDSGTNSSATLAKGTLFTTSVNGVNYSFQTLADTVSSRYNSETNNFEFDEVVIYEGQSKTTKFFFNNNNNEKFSLPDNNIDTNTLKVIVKDSSSAVNSTTYTEFRKESIVDSNSNIYYLNENYDGFYQIEFGNGTLGNRPIANSVIECSYLISNEREPNGAITFEGPSSFPANTSLADSGAITTISNASGGASKESIESIQFNAPRSFISQNRAVTLSDYEVNVREAISDVQDIAVYGGQTLNPPQYGKVFISVKPQSGLYLTDGQKQAILNYLESKKIVTVIPEVVDADYTFIYVNVSSKYNSNNTSLTRAQLESEIRESINTFNNNFLQRYGNNFRYSKLLSSIDNTNESISGTIAQVYSYKRQALIPGSTSPLSIDFGFQLLGDVSQAGSFISTTGWTFGGRTYYLEDKPISGDKNKRTLERYYLNENNVKVIEKTNIGFLYPQTGKITLEAQPSDTETFLDITVIPLSYDIPGIENKLLTIDLTKSIIRADNNLSTKNSGIVSDSYVVAPDAPMVSSGYNPTASGIFVPHTMYDPVTGVAYYAGTQALHLEYSSLGYVHYIPVTSASVQQTSTIIRTATETPSAPVASSTTTTTTTSTNTGTSNTGNGGGGYTPPSNPTPPSDGGYSGY
jgi:hypothetical protein